MNRKYTLADFRREGRALRPAGFPSCAITTDIIVGFPGETEADFEATLTYVDTGVFANAFTFIYSTRRGTPAARWEQVPQDVVFARFDRLVDAQNRVTRAYHERKVGTRRSRADRGRVEERREQADRQDARQRHDRRAEAADSGATGDSPTRDAVARRRDRKRPRLGMHGNDRGLRRALHGSAIARYRPRAST